MSDLRAIAERILAINLQRVNGGIPQYTFYKEELADAHNLARAVIASLDLPADVQAAMERLRLVSTDDWDQYHTAYQKAGLLDGPYSYLNNRILEDRKLIADHFLANPLHLDVPDERYRFMAIYEMIPKQFRVAVCEGGGEPDWESSVCVSIAKMRDSIANPIRIDVDREQLLRDVKIVESMGIHRGGYAWSMHATEREAALRLAAHTRRTLKGEK